MGTGSLDGDIPIDISGTVGAFKTPLGGFIDVRTVESTWTYVALIFPFQVLIVPTVARGRRGGTLSTEVTLGANLSLSRITTEITLRTRGLHGWSQGTVTCSFARNFFSAWRAVTTGAAIFHPGVVSQASESTLGTLTFESRCWAEEGRLARLLLHGSLGAVAAVLARLLCLWWRTPIPCSARKLNTGLLRAVRWELAGYRADGVSFTVESWGANDRLTLLLAVISLHTGVEHIVIAFLIDAPPGATLLDDLSLVCRKCAVSDYCIWPFGSDGSDYTPCVHVFSILGLRAFLKLSWRAQSGGRRSWKTPFLRVWPCRNITTGKYCTVAPLCGDSITSYAQSGDVMRGGGS
jgi:hypothetical protein